MPDSDISSFMDDIEKLMDISVAAKDYVIRESSEPYDRRALIDLNQIDFDALQAQFAATHKHLEFEKLRGAVESKLKRMVQLNKNRADYFESFQRLIDEYNSGSANVDLSLQKLVDFTRELNFLNGWCPYCY